MNVPMYITIHFALIANRKIEVERADKVNKFSLIDDYVRTFDDYARIFDTTNIAVKYNTE